MVNRIPYSEILNCDYQLAYLQRQNERRHSVANGANTFLIYVLVISEYFKVVHGHAQKVRYLHQQDDHHAGLHADLDVVGYLPAGNALRANYGAIDLAHIDEHIGDGHEYRDDEVYAQLLPDSLRVLVQWIHEYFDAGHPKQHQLKDNERHRCDVTSDLSKH